MKLFLNTAGAVFLICHLFTNPLMAQMKRNDRPNVIFILADDMGRGMLSYYGQKMLTTPNIDRIAYEGVSFERSYAGVYCAPSRASLITGYSDCHSGKYTLTKGGIYEEVATGVLTDEEAQAKVDSAIGNEPNITYLAQVFKKAGYITAEVGKLDYGFATSTKQMKNHGWDYYYGYYDHIMCHGFYPPFLHENGKLIKIPGNTHPDAAKTGEWGDPKSEKDRWNMDGKSVYSQDLFIDKILTFIRTHKNKPFFLYHPTQLPHGPVSIPSIHPEVAFNKNLTQIEKEYASMVKKLDDNVGLIMQELKKQGMDENTIVIFSSDNGHEIYYCNKGRVEKPYKNMKTGQLFNNVTDRYYSDLAGDIFDGNNGMAGLKRSNWEGGARVPLFIRWPGKFKAGYKAPPIVTNYDLLSTMADLLRVKTKDKKDGLSYLPALKHDLNFKGHQDIAFVSYLGPALITDDGWKLRYQYTSKQYELYHLTEDYKESNNLIEKYPEMAEKLKGKLIEKCDGDINNGVFSDTKNLKPVK
jgi:arylsulfatase A-like enzyme